VQAAIFLEQALAPVSGGTGRYSIELAAALVRTGNQDDSVTSWTAWHRDMAPAFLAGVAGPRRLPVPRRALAEAWRYGVGPAPHGADVLHAPTLLVPPRRRYPLVVTIHDAVPWTHPQTLTPRGARWHRAMAERATRIAAAIAVPTHAVADELAAALPALRAVPVHVLGAGVTRAVLREPDAAYAERVSAALALPERFVLSLATLEPRKGLDVLIEALATIGASAPQLLVVGHAGWGGVDPGAAASRAGLPHGRLRVLGRLEDPELAVVLRRATMLVAPSRAEGFGLPVAEAMAVGTPVVCSDAPALVEVAGGAAAVVPRGDAGALAAVIAKLLDDSAERDRMADAGQSRATAFDWDRVAERAWALYRSLASG
jgi:glycosyltransferase involved in cell wall biosynthesis